MLNDLLELEVNGAARFSVRRVTGQDAPARRLFALKATSVPTPLPSYPCGEVIIQVDPTSEGRLCVRFEDRPWIALAVDQTFRAAATNLRQVAIQAASGAPVANISVRDELL